MNITRCVIFAFAWCVLPFCSASPLQSLKYDLYFYSAMSWQMPGIDWRWLKAQCYQESRFNPKAVSPVGAGGVCQFMPATWTDVPDVIRKGASVYDARTNIEAAAWYDSKLYRFWRSKRPVNERLKLMLASYNAGAGNLAKAQKRCDMAVLYDPIIKCLPDITGRHSKETIDYVIKITKFRDALDP